MTAQPYVSIQILHSLCSYYVNLKQLIFPFHSNSKIWNRTIIPIYGHATQQYGLPYNNMGYHQTLSVQLLVEVELKFSYHHTISFYIEKFLQE